MSASGANIARDNLNLWQKHDLLDASAAIKHGAALGESVQSIKKIISDAKRQIKSKKAQMVKHLDRFATSISTELERWYEGGDIFDLPAKQFQQAMRGTKQTVDLEHWFQYLCRTLASAVEKGPRSDEEYGDETLKFVDKFFMVVQTFLDRDDPGGAFNLLILLKCLYSKPQSRLSNHQARLVHRAIDDACMALINGTSPPQLPRPHSARSDPTIRSPFDSTLGDGSLKWDRASSSSTKNWRLASLTSTLGKLYRSKLETEDCHVSYVDYVGERCFHTLSVDLLWELQRRAWSEVRYNVFSTIGTVLPSELTEHVFEYALSAAQLPSDPTIYRSVDQKGVLSQVKETYQCTRMKASESNWENGSEASFMSEEGFSTSDDFDFYDDDRSDF